eukprot:TRINITY_DN2329_c0_g1_i2.p1 TRINITY_DN2329_c0_g1~~TRINITY_DN2329_c0_g1_i2.p1  ORF type:complete len:929 (-),score=208.15 TRINITY_DN2329_c0_g1_i2:147-2933(-)
MYRCCKALPTICFLVLVASPYAVDAGSLTLSRKGSAATRGIGTGNDETDVGRNASHLHGLLKVQGRVGSPDGFSRARTQGKIASWEQPSYTSAPMERWQGHVAKLSRPSMSGTPKRACFVSANVGKGLAAAVREAKRRVKRAVQAKVGASTARKAAKRVMACAMKASPDKRHMKRFLKKMDKVARKGKGNMKAFDLKKKLAVKEKRARKAMRDAKTLLLSAKTPRERSEANRMLRKAKRMLMSGSHEVEKLQMQACQALQQAKTAAVAGIKLPVGSNVTLDPSAKVAIRIGKRFQKEKQRVEDAEAKANNLKDDVKAMELTDAAENVATASLQRGKGHRLNGVGKLDKKIKAMAIGLKAKGAKAAAAAERSLFAAAAAKAEAQLKQRKARQATKQARRLAKKAGAAADAWVDLDKAKKLQDERMVVSREKKSAKAALRKAKKAMKLASTPSALEAAKVVLQAARARLKRSEEMTNATKRAMAKQKRKLGGKENLKRRAEQSAMEAKLTRVHRMMANMKAEKLMATSKGGGKGKVKRKLKRASAKLKQRAMRRLKSLARRAEANLANATTPKQRAEAMTVLKNVQLEAKNFGDGLSAKVKQLTKRGLKAEKKAEVYAKKAIQKKTTRIASRAMTAAVLTKRKAAVRQAKAQKSLADALSLAKDRKEKQAILRMVKKTEKDTSSVLSKHGGKGAKRATQELIRAAGGKGQKTILRLAKKCGRKGAKHFSTDGGKGKKALWRLSKLLGGKGGQRGLQPVASLAKGKGKKALERLSMILGGNGAKRGLQPVAGRARGKGKKTLQRLSMILGGNGAKRGLQPVAGLARGKAPGQLAKLEEPVCVARGQAPKQSAFPKQGFKNHKQQPKAGKPGSNCMSYKCPSNLKKKNAAMLILCPGRWCTDQVCCGANVETSMVKGGEAGKLMEIDGIQNE